MMGVPAALGQVTEQGAGVGGSPAAYGLSDLSRSLGNPGGPSLGAQRAGSPHLQCVPLWPGDSWAAQTLGPSRMPEEKLRTNCIRREPRSLSLGLKFSCDGLHHLLLAAKPG